MEVAGIICEYNPFHLGHAGHIGKIRDALGDDCAVVCVMSGNFVQRGDFAVFNKHARADAAVLCGADLVVEMPAPYALLSAERFASAGVFILDRLKICGHISFGSESGDLKALWELAGATVSQEADMLIKEGLNRGLPYAVARQKAADLILGPRAQALRSPNNLLGVEYLKAIAAHKSQLSPMTVQRIGGAHDGDIGFSSSAIRKKLLKGEKLNLSEPGEEREESDNPFEAVPSAAQAVYLKEIADGRGPVSMKSYELAMLSRLRAIKDFSWLPDATEGLEHRFLRCAASEPTIARILESVKTKRYAMSRIRRMLMCACLGITDLDTRIPPPYIRVLAMNRKGMGLLKEARDKSELPIITKPAHANRLAGRALEIFRKEAAATDFYVLAYQDESARTGGQEWRSGPRTVGDSG